jgi:hypothetical protein
MDPRDPPVPDAIPEHLDPDPWDPGIPVPRSHHLADRVDNPHTEGGRTERFAVVEVTAYHGIAGGAQQYLVHDFRRHTTHFPERPWKRSEAEALRAALNGQARARGEALTVPLTPGTEVLRRARPGAGYRKPKRPNRTTPRQKELG